MRTISLAITHYNRFDFLMTAMSGPIADHRIREIVVSDDASTDGSYQRLVEMFGGDSIVKLFRNAHNLDCYRNKHSAVKHSLGEWVLLFDDDNILPTEYLDALYAIDPWDPKTAYCPVHARPHFDYRAFAGLTVDASNVAHMMTRPHFATALNTANYFFNRAEWLRVWDGSVDPHTSDSIFQNLNWLKGGNRIHFVPGMWYEHRVHAGSHYKREHHKTGNFAEIVEERLRAMR